MKPYGADRHFTKDVKLDDISNSLPDTNTYRKPRAQWKRSLRGHARMANKQEARKYFQDSDHG